MIKLYNLVKEVKFKLEVLPESYFIEYCKQELIPQLEELVNDEIKRARVVTTKTR